MVLFVVIVGSIKPSINLATAESNDIGLYDLISSALLPGQKSGVILATFHMHGIDSSDRFSSCVKNIISFVPLCFSMTAEVSGPKAFDDLIFIMPSQTS